METVISTVLQTVKHSYSFKSVIILTDVETNDELDDVTKEKYERINKELYGDVNVSLTDAEPADKEKDDEEMTVTSHVNVNQEGAGNQVKDDAQATQKTEGPIPSLYISFDYVAKYLNFNNIPLVDTEVISMLDINVQHEVPRTSPLLTIPVSVIPEHTIVNPPEIVITASSTTISSLVLLNHPAATLSTIKSEVPNAVKEYLGTSLDDALYKVLKKHDADIIKEHSVLTEIVERLIHQYVPKKSNEDIRKIKMEHARKQPVPKETITSSDTSALKEFDQKTTLFQTMTNSKSFNRSPKQRALYHALMKSNLGDEDAMNEGVADRLKKRKQDGRKSIETSKGKSKSQPKSTNKSAQTEETVFEARDTQEPHNQGQDMGNTDDQPNVEAALKHDWFKKPKRHSTLDSDWNVRKSVDFRPPQMWISKIV
ncbi:hypothetical protein Tco_0969757 [Tanacetum coccineum]